MANATLLVIHGVEAGARYDLGDRPVTLGRSVHCDLRIHDTEVSRLHAIIEPAGGGFQLNDRNSSNGTFVNGEPVRSKPLAAGDQIQIGRTVLVYMDGEAGESVRDRMGQVELLARHDPTDRSSIVAKIASDDHLDLRAAIQGGREESNLRVLYRISEEAVRPSVSTEQLLQRILDITLDAVNADHGCILLCDERTQDVRPQAMSRRSPADGAERMIISRTIVDYALKHRQGVRTSDAQHDQRFGDGQSILQAGIREAMCVPMQGRQGMLGALYVDITTPAQELSRAPSQSRFQEESLRLLVAIGRQAALAVENSRYQQALLQAERLAAMGQTIATLSHHIKNILQGIRGGSYLIDLGLNEHNETMMRKGWGIVEKNQEKIFQLVMDMLAFSKERQPLLQLADLNATTRDVVELMQSRADECGVTLEFSPGAELPESTFDAEGIHRAVLNIVTNAIDAVEGIAGARVAVATGYVRESDVLWISVVDNGPGIPPELRDRIFNVFESTKGARGTGLGLAVSQKILREHGGEIRVDSEPNHGSRFTLAWPRIDEEHPIAGRRTLS